MSVITLSVIFLLVGLLLALTISPDVGKLVLVIGAIILIVALVAGNPRIKL